MERRMWMVLAGFGVLLVGVHAAGGRWGTALLTAVLLGAATWWMSPLRGGRDVMTRAQALESGRDVVVYWRPGCVFCERLRRGLGRDGRRAAWVDIWRDPDAAAYVRSVNDGNETVPTVVVGGEPHTNPGAAQIRPALVDA